MKNIAAVLCAVSLSAGAAVVGEAKGPRGVSILLYEAPCQIKMPDKKPRFQVDFLEADGRVRWNGCWRVENEAIHMIWADGDVSLLPAGVFNFGPTKRNVPDT
jgi:hypothetical protein